MPILADSSSSGVLATQADVEAELGRNLTTAEANRVDSLLVKASGVVIGYTGQDFEPAPYPALVVAVTAGIVARSLATSPDGAALPEQQNAGPFGVRYGSSVAGGGVWLTQADKLALRPHRLGGGLTSVQLVGDRYDITPSV